MSLHNRLKLNKLFAIWQLLPLRIYYFLPYHSQKRAKQTSSWLCIWRLRDFRVLDINALLEFLSFDEMLCEIKILKLLGFKNKFQKGCQSEYSVIDI